MKIANTNAQIINEINKIISSTNIPKVVLVGGCSRSGKSTFVREIEKEVNNAGVLTEALSLDNWLISIENRKRSSTVIERYEISRIVQSIKKILNRETIFPPVYNPELRRRTSNSGNIPKYIDYGILFIEGTIALGIEQLRNMSDYSIYVDIPDNIRIERLMDFYTNTKKVDLEKSKKIILERENEEVLFIKNTMQYANLVYNKYY